jgi:hypothetical protein
MVDGESSISGIRALLIQTGASSLQAAGYLEQAVTDHEGISSGYLSRATGVIVANSELKCRR